MSSNRVLPAVLGFAGAGLIVLGALLPEYNLGGQGVAQIDPSRMGWVPALVGMLVEVGLVLSASLMLILGESRQIAGGILLGAGILGLTLRVVRLFQLAAIPEITGGDGSWVDLIAALLTVSAGVLALRGSREEPEDADGYDEDEPVLAALAPPAGELPPRPDP